MSSRGDPGGGCAAKGGTRAAGGKPEAEGVRRAAAGARGGGFEARFREGMGPEDAHRARGMSSRGPGRPNTNRLSQLHAGNSCNWISPNRGYASNNHNAAG
jgi:hypothetical protein